MILEDLSMKDKSELSGEGLSEVVINLANYFSDASQAPNTSLKQQCKLWCLTEGRHTYGKYSSCGDLLHSVISLIGVRDTALVNRDHLDFDGNKNSSWKVGLNISKLIEGSKTLGSKYNQQIWVSGKEGLLPNPGDMCLIGENGLEHVFIITDKDGDNLHSVDLSQVDLGGQCAKRRIRKLEKIGNDWWTISIENGQPVTAGLGKRKLIGYISTPSLWNAITKQIKTI